MSGTTSSQTNAVFDVKSFQFVSLCSLYLSFIWDNGSPYHIVKDL